MKRWVSPTRPERLAALKQLVAQLADDLKRARTAADLDSIRWCGEQVARLTTYLYNSENRCKRGHVVVPGRETVCTQCGAVEVELDDYTTRKS